MQTVIEQPKGTCDLSAIPQGGYFTTRLAPDAPVYQRVELPPALANQQPEYIACYCFKSHSVALFEGDKAVIRLSPVGTIRFTPYTGEREETP